jgi:hypothetical protein
MPELTITSPYVHFRIDSSTFTMGNSMPESTLTLCQSRLYSPVSSPRSQAPPPPMLLSRRYETVSLREYVRRMGIQSCYLTLDYATAASPQDGACIAQQMFHIMILFHDYYPIKDKKK